MKKAFNLKNYMTKTAFYDDARGYILKGSRAWPNCIKHKMDGDKKSKQEAYMSCIEEYNTWDSGKFVLTYTESYPDAIKNRSEKVTPGSQALQIDKGNKQK